MLSSSVQTRPLDPQPAVSARLKSTVTSPPPPSIEVPSTRRSPSASSERPSEPKRVPGGQITPTSPSNETHPSSGTDTSPIIPAVMKVGEVAPPSVRAPALNRKKNNVPSCVDTRSTRSLICSTTVGTVISGSEDVPQPLRTTASTDRRTTNCNDRGPLYIAGPRSWPPRTIHQARSKVDSNPLYIAWHLRAGRVRIRSCCNRSGSTVESHKCPL